MRREMRMDIPMPATAKGRVTIMRELSLYPDASAIELPMKAARSSRPSQKPAAMPMPRPFEKPFEKVLRPR